MEYGQTVKNWKRVDSGNQKYREGWKHWSSAFRRHSSVSTFVNLPWLGSACKIGFHPGISLVDPGDAALCFLRRLLLPPSTTAATVSHSFCRHRPLLPPPAMVDPGPLRPPRSVAEALGTGSIPADLAAILGTDSRTVREDRADLPPEKCLGINSFLEHLALGVDMVPGLERVTLVVVNPYGRVLLMQSLFSVRVDLYSTQRLMFACLVEMPSEGLPPVVSILDEAFAARSSIRTIP